MIRIKKFKVDEYTSVHKEDTVIIRLVVNYKTIRYNFDIPYNDMTKYIKEINNYNNRTHDLIVLTDSKNKFIGLENERRVINRGASIDKFYDKPFEPINMINYNRFNCFTQLDGITTLVGMSGAGKTWNALQMLPVFANYFDKIAYLNYELSHRDIIIRFNDLFPAGHKRDNTLNKLFIKTGVMTSLDIAEILEDMNVKDDEKIVFIIDNVGSVIGQEDNVWKKQNEFIKEIDNLAKEHEYHVLALTQIIKDHNLSVFNETGEIKDTITMSIMSGSIMLGNLSRSVLFTAYNHETEEFKVKVLKRGTGIYYHDLDPKEIKNEYIKR